MTEKGYLMTDHLAVVLVLLFFGIEGFSLKANGYVMALSHKCHELTAAPLRLKNAACQKSKNDVRRIKYG